MLLRALALVLATSQQTPRAAADAPPAPAGSRQLDTPAQVRTLCDTLTPSERAVRRGDVIVRARAEADHDARREAALNGRYRVIVAGDRLRFAEYDPAEEQLALADGAVLTAAGGSLRIWAVEEAGLPVAAEAAIAQRVVQAAARRTLVLAITFTLPEDDDEVACAHPNGSDRYGLGVEPIGWEYLDRGQVLARGGEGADHPLVDAARGARPRVRVSDPVGGSRELKAALEAREKDLEGCYQRALKQNPGLDGSLVAEVELAGGAARSVRMAVDSLQDQGMADCVGGVVSKAEFPRGQDVRAQIPIHFDLEPPAEQSGTGAGAR